MKTISIRKIEHHNQTRIACIFKYNKETENIIRAIPKSSWSQSRKCWHIPYDKESWNHLQSGCTDKVDIFIEDTGKDTLKSKPEVKLKSTQAIPNKIIPIQAHDKSYLKSTTLKGVNLKIWKDYISMLEIKKYSQATISAYLPFFHDYLLCFEKSEKPVDTASYAEIYGYIMEKTRLLGETQTKQLICAIKFYYEHILGHDKLFFTLGSRQNIKPVQIILDYVEISEIASASISNGGHRLCLWLVFYLGMRAEDILNLTKEFESTLQKYPRYVENQKVSQQIGEMAQIHLKQTQNIQFLYEMQGHVFSVGEMRNYIWWVISKYKLEIIYRKQFRNLIAQTDFEKSTCDQYESHFMHFIRENNYVNPAMLGQDKILAFLKKYGQGKSADAQNAMITALRFYYRYCLNRDFLPHELPRARIPHAKPQVLSLQEVASIIDSIENEKHRMLISVIYSAGLRRSEAQNLKLSDIDYSRGMLFIKAAKGKKDRFSLLSKQLEEALKSYVDRFKPIHYVFEGEKPGTPYSFTSMDQILKHAVVKAGIKKRVNLHLLRHSFATHVIEDGYDTRYLQQLLGHNSIKTTQRYTHLTNESVINVRSPFDKLLLKPNKDRGSPKQ